MFYYILGKCTSGPDNKFLKSASWTSTQHTHQDVQSKEDPDTFGSLADQHGRYDKSFVF